MTSPIRVLHVDDDPEFADLTAAFLERTDDRFDVETATDADAGLEQIADAEFDCVVSDYDMPGQNGIEFLRSVRAEHRTLPFILFTGKGSEEVASDAISADVTDYLEKAAGTEQYELLANRITNAVSRCRARTNYRELFEKTTVGLVIADPETGTMADANPAYADIVGHDREDIAGANPGELTPENPPYTESDAERQIGRAVKDGPESFEWLHETGDGDERWVEVTLAPAVLDGQQRVLASVEDITERKAHERELERQNDLFKRAQDIADVGVWEYDAATDEVTWSAQTYEIFGVPQDTEITVDRAIEQYHPDDRATIREALTAAAEDAEPYDIELRVFTDGDDQRWIRTRGHPQTEDGSVVRARGTVQDITDRKQRERALQAERDRYQSLFENNPLVIWEQDLSDVMEAVNTIADEVTDLEAYLRENPAELDRLASHIETIDVNRNALSYYDAPSKEELIDNLDEVMGEVANEALAAEWAALADGETRFRAETVARTLSGERREELLSVFVPEGNTDDFSRVYVTGTDITERKQRERRLRRQNERLDKFTSVVSHDLRNPLNIASSRLELAAAECDSPHLDDLADAHERMERLIDDLLTFARAGSEAMDREAVDLPRLLEECWGPLQNGASLVVETERAIRADPDRLRQLFENLLTNAVEHGSTSTQASADDPGEHGGAGVSVTVGDVNGGFYIEDDGPGIPDSERANVFEAGYSTAGTGTGFGLSIVAEVAEAHGWDVTVTDGTDGGARFEVTGVESVE